MAEKTKAPVTDLIVMPAVTPEEAKLAMQKYQDLVAAICTKDDYQKIEGKNFRKKSGWRKIATAFNLSTEVVEERSEQIGKTFVWHFTVKATAPNGRYTVGVGSCDAFEKAKLADGKYQRYDKWAKRYVEATPNSVHNIRSTAETRAVNRAISDLVGAGEVSAEEIGELTGNGHSEVKTAQDAPAVSPAVAKAVAQVTNGKCQYCGTTGKYHKRGCPGVVVKPAVPAEQAAPDEGSDQEVPPTDIPF